MKYNEVSDTLSHAGRLDSINHCGAMSYHQRYDVCRAVRPRV